MSDTESIKKMIAYRLKIAREMAGLSQNQVAKMLDLKRPSISEIEAGRRKVSVDEIAKLAEIYDVDASWLIRTGESTIDEIQEKIELAAREFNKLKPEDVDRLIDILSMIRGKEGKD